MSQDVYDEYKEGFEAGAEAGEDSNLSGAAQQGDEKWMGRYAGKEGNWDDPPSEDDDEEEGEYEEGEDEEEEWEDEEDEWRDEDEDEE